MTLVASFGCIVTGQPAEIHHVKCFSHGAGKVSDFLVIPLAHELHRNGSEAIHNNRSLFEMLHGREVDLLAKTIEKVAMKLKQERIPF